MICIYSIRSIFCSHAKIQKKGFHFVERCESLLRSKYWLITVDDSCLRKSHQHAIPIATGICNGKWKN